jgi:energy-converting hydrogenase Eha subunit B
MMNAPVQQRRTPYPHCLAGASVWYVAAAVAFAASALKTGSGWAGVLGALVIGVVPMFVSSLLVWLIARNYLIQPWLLILIALPFFAAMWAATNLSLAGLSILAGLLF